MEYLIGVTYTVCFGLLTFAAVQDIRIRKVSLWVINATLCMGAVQIALRSIAVHRLAQENIVGFFALSVPLLIMALIKRDSVGGADIRIAAGVGAVLGVVEILVSYVVAAVLVVVFVPVSALLRRKRPDFRQSVPLLPFLLCGCVSVFALEIVTAATR